MNSSLRSTAVQFLLRLVTGNLLSIRYPGCRHHFRCQGCMQRLVVKEYVGAECLQNFFLTHSAQKNTSSIRTFHARRVRITLSCAGAHLDVTRAVLIGASSAVQFFCSFDSSVRNLANGPALSGLLALRLSFSSNASSPCSLKICSDSSENNTASPSKAMRICLI